MHELAIQGTSSTISRMPEPEGTPFEIANGLIEADLDMPSVKVLPDSALVVLLDGQVEEYLPPRCRKPRKRIVRKEVARFSLGEFRKKFYWLSIEGSGSSVLPVPLTKAEMLKSWANRQWADQCIGFPSESEQQRMHQICLESPIPAVEEEMAKLVPRVKAGEVVVWTPESSRLRK
jgi:hypothetical protein